MLHTIEIYFLLLISYAFLGWCMEVTCKFIQLDHIVLFMDGERWQLQYC